MISFCSTRSAPESEINRSVFGAIPTRVLFPLIYIYLWFALQNAMNIKKGSNVYQLPDWKLPTLIRPNVSLRCASAFNVPHTKFTIPVVFKVREG